MNFRNWSPLTSIPENFLSRIRLAHVFDRQVLLVTNEDEVLSCGTNNCGCLGLNDTAPRLVPESVTELHRKRVKGGESKCLFVIAHTYTGTIYMWGRNHGNNVEDYILKPTLVDQLTKKVTDVVCGKEHYLALNIHGEVFGWGGNTWGQLGINSQNRTAVPVKLEGLLAGKLVLKLSCGLYFSAAVLDSGQVFLWGCNDEGQLGVNDHTINSIVPKRISNLDGVVIKKIICGPKHVLAVNDVCELYVWGNNYYGELGLGDIVNRLIPVKNETVGRVTNVAASYISYTSAALTENFKVLMWGECAGLNLVRPQETVYESLNDVYAHYSIPCIMYKSMIRDLGYESVSETLINAFDDKETSDLIIIAEGKEIFVHRAILKLRSEYFRILLNNQWTDETQECISIDQSYNAIHAYLKYLYEGKFKAEPNLALELLPVADEYNDRLLKKLCEKAIKYGITIDNVAYIYSVALKLNGTKLLKNCLSFAANHLSEVVDTSGFDDWDVKTMKEFFRESRKRKLFRS